MHKPWLDNYPEGVDHDIDRSAYASLNDVIAASVERFQTLPAFTNLGATLSYAQIDRASRDFAAYLQADLGLAKGDRVAIMLPNLLQYPVVLFGALRAGLVVVNTNPLYTARELQHQLADADVSAIVILENFAHVLAEVLPNVPVPHVIVTGVGDLLHFPKSLLVNFVLRHVQRKVPAWRIAGAVRLRAALRRGARHALQPVALGHDDLAFLQYTGGTTGVCKGAMLSHGNMLANLLQATAWLKPVVREGQEIIITALPLYHIFALTANCLTFFRIGGMNVLITNPRDMPGFVKTLTGVRFTAITGVNTLFNGLLNTPGFEQLDFSALHVTLGGGMAVQRSVAERWQRVTGCVLAEAYGLTETSPAVCMNPFDIPAYNASIGLPVPSTDCAILDDDGNELPTGEVGELCVRGPQVMQGYWRRPDETAKVIDAQGWLHTGDIASMDEQGYFRIVDRKKDMILVSGFNVYPNEIEDVVSAHPGVAEVGAIGVPDEHSGEVVKIVVVRKDTQLTAEALTDYCRSRLAGYKRPKIIEFRDSLPKTPVGKILRRALREQSGGQA